MINHCVRCGIPLERWLHLCRSTTMVVHFQAYCAFLEEMRQGNPLDRLTMADWGRIQGKDPDEERRAFEAMREESNRAYFSGRLTYRVELHNLSGIGFQGGFDHIAVECEGASDEDWATVLDFIILGQSQFPNLTLEKDHVYLCRLVSFDRGGIKYVWNTKKLAYETRWTLSDWN